jgi:hypothetical protein
MKVSASTSRNDGESSSDNRETENSDAARGCFRRSQQDDFDWLSLCFICGTNCSSKHRNEWSLVASIEKGSTSMYNRILKAAEQYQDHAMLARLYGVPNGDLVAYDARYHRTKNCLSKYLQGQISTITYQIPDNDETDKFKIACRKLVSEFQHRILQEKEVFLLTTLKQRYQELLEEEGIETACEYRSNKLKNILSQHWEDISFIPQPGMSDLVCSKDLSVGDVLVKA